jgi:serine/tyrosine/threonine adenylyltransferase
MNPFLNLNYELGIEKDLGSDYYDQVAAAVFPQHILRWRNDSLLPLLGLKSEQVSDSHFLEAFGHFQSSRPLLALRYHGYQFGEYNPRLGDGRGFLYGQVRGTNQNLYDFGTKGSGKTPYSRSADGCLTLKGGVREVLAAEALHRMGVLTSRCLSLVETGEQLWRGDEPSPTRSSVMVRFQRSHIRFGTFERLHYLGRADLITKLLDWVIATYYAHLLPNAHPNFKQFCQIPSTQKIQIYQLFYRELVQKVAELTAQWMSVGFCHAVLNTDNMAITAESFDYGPFAFIETYNPKFTAAYFDHYGRYCYANQPAACQWNLQMLQYPLKMVTDGADLEAALDDFGLLYQSAYLDRMLAKIGFNIDSERSLEIDPERLILALLRFLNISQINYHDFFIQLRQRFALDWRDDSSKILRVEEWNLNPESTELLDQFRILYHQSLSQLPMTTIEKITDKLIQQNPIAILTRPKIESVWEQISINDNWQPFQELIQQLSSL